MSFLSVTTWDLGTMLTKRSSWSTLVLQKSSIRRFVITEKAPTRAFSWLKAVWLA